MRGGRRCRRQHEERCVSIPEQLRLGDENVRTPVGLGAAAASVMLMAVVT